MPGALILLNRSARGVMDETIGQLCEFIRRRQLDARVETVNGEALTWWATRAIESGCTSVVAAGGDGTVSTVAAVAAAHSTGQRRVALGVIPLGTLNHFARDVGIPGDVEAAIGTLACGRLATIDVGEVNGQFFVNNSSIGVYPRMLWEREQQQRRGYRKWSALGLAALQVWRQYRPITVTIEERELRSDVRTPFVFIGNNEYAIDGGRIDARKSLDAGRLQLCIAPDADRGRMGRIVLAAIAGRLGTVEGFEAMTASELTISTRARRFGVSLDGELKILDGPLRYRIRPRALQVIVPGQNRVL